MIGELVKKGSKYLLRVSKTFPEQDYISILLDFRNEDAIRDDAAMDLGDFEGEPVISTLFYVAIMDPSHTVRESCAASLGEILSRLSADERRAYIPLIDRLQGVARLEFDDTLRLASR